MTYAMKGKNTLKQEYFSVEGIPSAFEIFSNNIDLQMSFWVSYCGIQACIESKLIWNKIIYNFTLTLIQDYWK